MFTQTLSLPPALVAVVFSIAAAGDLSTVAVGEDDGFVSVFLRLCFGEEFGAGVGEVATVFSIAAAGDLSAVAVGEDDGFVSVFLRVCFGEGEALAAGVGDWA